MKQLLLISSLIVVLFGSTSKAFAWGERGHDLVTRVAARLMASDPEYSSQFRGVFLNKEHMLAHLANVPDIVWRNMGREIEDINGPTHYIDIEYVTLHPVLSEMPKTPADMEAIMKRQCAEKKKGYICPAESGDPKAAMAGTAPFRVQQMTNLMKDSFQKAKDAQAKNDEKTATKALDDAFFYAGILSHFVGDLANPYHATRDYNGYEIDQGGVHKYFESDTVISYDLKFDGDVYGKAAKGRALASLKKILSSVKGADKDPLMVAYAEVIDSFSLLKKVQQMDAKFAVLKKGRIEKGMKIKAERRPAQDVTATFRSVISDRIALGADTLAYLWRHAWVEGGKPDLKSYESYDYRTTPDFLQPNY